MNNPVFVVVAGPNGAGKSSLVRANPLGFEVFNPDELAGQIGGSPVARMIHTGRMMHKLIGQAFQAGESFGIETTLSGHRTLALMAQAKEKGYTVALIYVGVDSLDLSKLRIGQRMKEGGHGVPERDVERRFPRSFANLPRALTIADQAQVFDNSLESGHRLIAEKKPRADLAVLDANVTWLRTTLES